MWLIYIYPVIENILSTENPLESAKAETKSKFIDLVEIP